ncbi:MAG TPA: FecR domain-containing protein [Rhizomicrobium sp.]|nr:FecR domain-containing protein [Rhizomicrobium sp.]
MNDFSPSQSVVARAKDVRAQAVHWFERRHFWDWSDRDQAEFDAWLAQSFAHRAAYVRLDTVWQRAELISAFRPASPSPRSAMFPLLLKMAAGFAIVAVIGAGTAAYLMRPQERVYSTAIGGHETVAFADGSRIELNTNTVLRARMTTQERVVWLDRGEAFFQIKHDSAHPFVVMAGKHRVTDLGTKFTVRREPNLLRVAVMQGRVTFDTPDSPTPSQVALLSPGDVATAIAADVSVKRASAKALKDETSWRHGALVFDKTALADAAAEFNRYNAKKIIIADPAVASLTIDGTFRTEDAELFSRIARVALGLHVEEDNNRILIMR